VVDLPNMQNTTDKLSALASAYSSSMTSIRGRRVQRLLTREFAGADQVMIVQLHSGGAAMLGVSSTGAALCATNGKGNYASIYQWSHGADEAVEIRYDLLKDSLPILATRTAPADGFLREVQEHALSIGG
jgi:hypothetical protein